MFLSWKNHSPFIWALCQVILELFQTTPTTLCVFDALGNFSLLTTLFSRSGFHFSKNVSQLSYVVSPHEETYVVTIIDTVVLLSPQETRIRFVAGKQFHASGNVTSI